MEIIVIVLFQGGRHSLPAEDKATTASETSTTSFQGIEQFNEKAVQLESPLPLEVS